MFHSDGTGTEKKWSVGEATSREGFEYFELHNTTKEANPQLYGPSELLSTEDQLLCSG